MNHGMPESEPEAEHGMNMNNSGPCGMMGMMVSLASHTLHNGILLQILLDDHYKYNNYRKLV